MTETTIVERQVYGKIIKSLKVNFFDNNCYIKTKNESINTIVELSKNEAQRMSDALQKFIKEV